MQMTNPEDIRRFIRGGRAVFTIVSKKTGTRFTYRVAVCKDNQSLFFVSLLTQADNVDGYQYFGTIRDGVGFNHGRKSAIGADAPGARAFGWFYNTIHHNTGEAALVHGEFWHEGRCCRCARRLTVPRSIANGIGPECEGRFLAEAA